MTTVLTATRPPRIPLGSTVITTNALDQLEPLAVEQALRRHAGGDWGELGPEDACQNDYAATHGGRLFSAYRSGDQRFWIITEADRSVTTVLLPLDY
jgi:hypothetical protein